VRVTSQQTRLMFANPTFQIVSVPGVIAAIGATEHVSPKSHCCPSIRDFDALRLLSRYSG
jgi:hypothetical protein